MGGGKRVAALRLGRGGRAVRFRLATPSGLCLVGVGVTALPSYPVLAYGSEDWRRPAKTRLSAGAGNAKTDERETRRIAGLPLANSQQASVARQVSGV